MSDPVDDLESMIADALSAAEAMNMLPEIQKVIAQWRQTWGGDSLYIARRAHIRRHAKIMDMIEQGLTTAEIAERLGASPRQVQRVRQKASSYL